ncbi:WD repeat-containing protein WRAP73 [Schistosoma japonicum]|nr:WD repeat-containing protein WRAP73 [Schistosoma japonicum]KAH8875687.1 WD repeat-containing protein WRAP73 [Schistosoma japonicum]KAH8875688.1 WD repeat-containing protein WRAP73 [Schistosoma japonicum]KAH8875689.1 WD repeat-containing protein WRAP73 [Schistosoma japonicum]KAH8875690.1 WD repeat-containing protein WRAP73 [Schistosoma japonicum]
MNFSDIVKVSNSLVVLSSNGIYVASASQHKVFIRIANTLQIFQIFGCVDVVNNILWSGDSLFLLCVLKSRSIAQIFSLENPDWTCKVDEGSAGLLNAIWSPDSRHFLTTTDFHLRITVWSISEVSVSYLKFPKACANNLAFCPGGRYLALLERRNFQDHLSLFDCRLQWTILWNITLNTDDAVGIVWSPDGRYILAYDNCLRYQASVYSVDGRHLCTYCAYKPAQELLGIKSISWSPTGQLLALGSYDQKCRLLNNFNWTCIACLKHPVNKPIDPSLGLSPSGHSLCANDEVDRDLTTYRAHRIDIYEEFRTNGSSDSSTNFKGLQGSSTVQYVLMNDPVTIQSNKPDPNQPFPKIGIGLTEFSSDGRFLATRNDNCSNVIWIWSIDSRLSLFSLLIHTSGSVSSLMWDPKCSSRLALCTGSDSVFLWTPQGCLVVQAPAHFNFLISSLFWLSSGDGILLQSENEFCLGYLDSGDKVEKHKPLWRPPQVNSSTGKLYQYETKRNSENELDLPFSDYVVNGDCASLSDIFEEDAPNWLKQHSKAPSDNNVKIRRRSLSSCDKHSVTNKELKPTRVLSSVSISRQAWLAPSPNIKLAKKSTPQKTISTKQ